MIKRILRFMAGGREPAEEMAARIGDAGAEAEVTVPPEWQPLLDEMELSSGHFFVTGPAGTGKSTLTESFCRRTGKNVVVLAPTGRGAIIGRGMTIHAFAQLPATVITSDCVREAGDRELVRAIDTIVIDEASQVRCDLLDGLDRFMRANGREADRPFGGVQLILAGDPYQLPPAVRDEERVPLTRAGYGERFFFWNAKVFPELRLRNIQMETVFHRADQEVLDVLGCIRANDIGKAHLDLLQRCVADPEFDPSRAPLHTRLTANNSGAAYYNNRELYRLPGPQHEYRAKRSGSAFNVDNPGTNFPCEENLLLRRGARVICCGTVGRTLDYGTMGTVVECEDEAVWIRTDDDRNVRLVPVTWELIKYSRNRETGRVQQSVTGTIQQIPLRHAWAVAIQRSQGLTLDRAYIDLSDGAFSRGQAYIALSRCRTLEGTRLKSRFFSINPDDIMVDDEVVCFMMRSFS